MAGEIEGEAREAGAGEEDGGGLEGPADVVAVAVDHADDGAGRRGGGQPGAGEEGGPSGGRVEGLAASDPMGRVEALLVGGLSPEVCCRSGAAAAAAILAQLYPLLLHTLPAAAAADRFPPPPPPDSAARCPQGSADQEGPQGPTTHWLLFDFDFALPGSIPHPGRGRPPGRKRALGPHPNRARPVS